MEALTYTCLFCGFIGLYDPKVEPNVTAIRRCPSCNAERDQYVTDGEVNDVLRRPPMEVKPVVRTTS